MQHEDISSSEEAIRGLLLLRRARPSRNCRSATFILPRIYHTINATKQTAEGTTIFTFPTHKCPVASAFAAFPESAPGFANQHCLADTAIFGSVDLFSRAETAFDCQKGSGLQGFCALGHTRSFGWRAHLDGPFLHRDI